MGGLEKEYNKMFYKNKYALSLSMPFGKLPVI